MLIIPGLIAVLVIIAALIRISGGAVKLLSSPPVLWAAAGAAAFWSIQNYDTLSARVQAANTIVSALAKNDWQLPDAAALVAKASDNITPVATMPTNLLTPYHPTKLTKTELVSALIPEAQETVDVKSFPPTVIVDPDKAEVIKIDADVDQDKIEEPNCKSSSLAYNSSGEIIGRMCERENGSLQLLAGDQ